LRNGGATVGLMCSNWNQWPSRLNETIMNGAVIEHRR